MRDARDSRGVAVEVDRRHSGPAVAQLFHRLLAAIFCAAWLSLGSQVEVLIGRRGLLPAADYLAAARNAGAGFADLPTVFWLDASDIVLRGGIWVGLALSGMALFGLWPRFCAGAATVLYLSYVSVARSFLSFQWDNLLLECGALAVFLPGARPARWIHVLFRVLLVKLYLESGIAKWQSPLGDWQDGSAMTWYYETAPLPTWIAWHAHHWPTWWHHVESRAVLGLELLLPFLTFGPRRARVALFFLLGGFQLLNLATANYGFFIYLALALQVFLLTDADVAHLLRRLPGREQSARQILRAPARVRRGVAVVVSTAYVGVSGLQALAAFTPLYPNPPPLRALLELAGRWRVVNPYHLFGYITRERIEPEFQVEVDGRWSAVDLFYKAGDPQRAPRVVAPHQPRVDFQLWFYGLDFERGTPDYVVALLDRLCDDPGAVQPLFATVLPPAPSAVRVLFWRYRFSDADRDGPWWVRSPIAESRPIPCAGAARPEG